MDTLIPFPTGPSDRMLLALDVDGVLNKFTGDPEQAFIGPERRHVRTAHGRGYYIDFEPEIIVELDTLIRDHNLELGWLTTWGPNARALVEQAFDGLLSGGFVLQKMPARYRGAIPANWKQSGLRDRVQATGQPWAWVDDDAIDMARSDSWFDQERDIGPRGLLVPTVPATGITREQIAAIRAHAVNG